MVWKPAVSHINHWLHDVVLPTQDQRNDIKFLHQSGHIVFWCLIGLAWNFWYAWRRTRRRVLSQFQTMVSESSLEWKSWSKRLLARHWPESCLHWITVGDFSICWRALEMAKFHKARFLKPLGYQGGADQCLTFLPVSHWRLICHGSSLAHWSADGKNARSIAVFICRKHSNLSIQAECWTQSAGDYRGISCFYFKSEPGHQMCDGAHNGQ